MTIVERKTAKQAYQESCEAVDRARIAEANGLATVAAVSAAPAPAAPTAKPARRAKKAKK